MSANAALLSFTLLPILIAWKAVGFQRAAVYSAVASLFVSVAIVIWYQSFFPYEGSARQQLASLSSLPQDQFATWLMFRAGFRAAIAAMVGALAFWVFSALRARRKN